MERFEKSEGSLFCTKRAELFYEKARGIIEDCRLIPIGIDTEKWRVERLHDVLCKAMYMDMDEVDYMLRYEQQGKDSKSG